MLIFRARKTAAVAEVAPWRRRLALMAPMVLAATLMPQVPAHAQPRPAPGVAADKSVPVTAVRPRPAAKATSSSKKWEPKPVQWPAAGTATAELPPASAGAAPRRVQVGRLPVSAGRVPAKSAARVAGAAPVGAVAVEVFGQETAQRLGLPGVVLRVARTDAAEAGPVSVDFDYSGFANAYGGDWASRLTLLRLPACAVTTPDVAECRAGEPAERVANNPVAGRLSADVPVSGRPAASAADRTAAVASGSVLAVTAAASSPLTGSFTKSSLGASASWQAGRQGGDFTWSYPMRVPPAPGGLEPDVELSYSSASVDGRTNAENAQTSWIGEGFDYHPGYIERQYLPCRDESTNAHYTNATSDLCFTADNATLMWNGKSSELVRDDGSGRWRLADDDGSRIEKLTGGSHTDHHNNERWRLTTTDGTQYYFGLNRLPGWQPGGRETGSALGVPVISNHANDPCFKTSGFGTSWCQMTWRWNLDYVVDAQGNSMSYWYSKEHNNTYVAGTLHGYDRASVLGRIEYGTRRGQEALSSAPSMQVVLMADDRCLDSCWFIRPPPTPWTRLPLLPTPITANWPDVPWDLDCPKDPCSNFSPSLWTTKRLATVVTQIRNGNSWKNVDIWSLTHQLPETGETPDRTSPAFWLGRIDHTGAVDGAKALPPVLLHGDRYANRTDHNVGTGVPMVNKYRLVRISNETGGETLVEYEGSDCPANLAGVVDDNNAKRCFPQFYAPPNGPANWSWWNKYRVKKVTERDLVGGSPDVVHTYGYSMEGSSTDVLWHYEDSPWRSRIEYREWTDFRGWPTVTVTTGTEGGKQSHSKYLYMRGMDGDRTRAGVGARRAKIRTSDGVEIVDSRELTGFLREETHYAAPDGQALEHDVREPKVHLTGSRTWQEPSRPSEPRFPIGSSAYVYAGLTQENVWLPHSRSWQRTETRQEHDPVYGTLVSTADAGDVAVDGDESCTSYRYAMNTGEPWLIDMPYEETTTNCAAKPGPSDVLAGERTYYDGSVVLGAAPTGGLETRTDVLASFTATTANYITDSTETYDVHGRTVSETDALGRTSTVAYTPKEGGPLTMVSTTNAAGHTTAVAFNPAWGAPTHHVDANNKVTVASYDALGRTAGVWRPGRNFFTQTPDEAFTYRTDSATTAHSVESKILGPNGNQIVSFDIYDGLLRPRQTQETSPDGKRAISDTRYDSRGLPVVESDLYNDASGPTGSLVTFADADVPSQTRLTYDSLGRVTHDALWSRNAEKWKTTVEHGGDRVHVTPPAGGIAETVVFDALDRPVKLLQHKAGKPSGDADETRYEYDRLDQLTAVVDPAGNRWTYSYDLRGRVTATTDPDAGEEKFDYDNADQLITSTDGRGTRLARVYDTLGRLTQLRDDTVTGALRAAWTYDTVAKGMPTSSTRHFGGQQYTAAVAGYTDDYTPTATSTTIPPAHGKLAGTYTTRFTYKEDGSPATATYPAIPAAGMAEETVTNAYTDAGDLSSVVGAETYIGSIDRYWHGAVKQRTLGAAGKRLRLSTAVDEATLRLGTSQVHTERRNAPDNWDEQLTEKYAYDPAGNVIAIKETSDAAGTTVSQQCFSHDYLRRLTEAWTTTADRCQSTPTQPAVGGPEAYWQSFTYDVVGNRLTDTAHSAGGDTTRDYVTPAAKAKQPHTLTRRDTRGGGPSTSYTYDPAGNLKTRTTGTSTETLNWDAEGHLEALVNGAKTHSYIYDPEGNRLIAKDPDATTAYLGHTELRLVHATNTVEATRYYPDAVRTTTGGLNWMVTDHHGTGQLAVNADTLATTRRRTTPFGELRGTPPTSWPDRKGFVGGTADPTGLVHLGAREYDPTTGRFISVDPLIEFDDPQTMQGYAYSNNSPVSYTDPDGLGWKDINSLGGGGGGGGGARSGGGGRGSGANVNGGSRGGGARGAGGRTVVAGPSRPISAHQRSRQQAKQADPAPRVRTQTKKQPPKITKNKPSKNGGKKAGGKKPAGNKASGKNGKGSGGKPKGKGSSKKGGASGKSSKPKGVEKKPKEGDKGKSRPAPRPPKTKIPRTGRNRDADQQRRDAEEAAREGQQRDETYRGTVGEGVDSLENDIAGYVTSLGRAANSRPPYGRPGSGDFESDAFSGPIVLIIVILRALGRYRGR